MKTSKLVVLVFAMALIAGGLWAAGSEEPAGGEKIAVVTPYMANATTAAVIKDFEAEAEARGWTVTVSDTAGDFGMLVSRIQDAVAQQVDAIVLGMGDPAQMTAGLNAAADADIPVFGLDAGLSDGVYLNVTSDNGDLGRRAAQALLDAIGNSGKVVLFTHDPHPGVRARADGARELFAEHAGIEIVRQIHIEVPGPVEFARGVTADLLTAYAKGEIDGIWAGWDEPAYGATQAINQAERDEIRVVGVDGTDFARQEIDSGDIFVATVVQDFSGMASELAELIAAYLEGEMPDPGMYTVPGTLYK
ncbi:MAG: substrate-binding domain-containing protein [Spirochaetaceae bacterium]|nr:substrate-binding domain-containing protein [Spirochaetaceae bacterium]